MNTSKCGFDETTDILWKKLKEYPMDWNPDKTALQILPVKTSTGNNIYIYNSIEPVTVYANTMWTVILSLSSITAHENEKYK